MGSPAMFSAILVGNQECMGIIAIMDKVRDAAPETLRLLKKKGMRVVMLTGDNERIAKAIATMWGLAGTSDAFHDTPVV